MLGLVRDKLIKKATQIAKIKKTTKWIMWIVKKLRKKGYLVDIDICAYGQNHIATRVRKFGNAYIFWSKGCSGCQVGQILIAKYKSNNKIPKELSCALLKNALISKGPVKEGEVVQLLPLDINR